MYCNGCGQALVAGQAYCPRCGRASGMMPPGAAGGGVGASAGGPSAMGAFPLMQVERRVNALAVGWFVYAGLIAVTGLLGMAFAQAFLTGHGGPWAHGFGHRFGEMPWGPMLWMRFAWVFVGLRLVLALAAGYGLMQKASWGRGVAIVAAILSLIHLPFGTGIAIWTLVVLLNGQNALGLEMMARD